MKTEDLHDAVIRVLDNIKHIEDGKTPCGCPVHKAVTTLGVSITELRAICDAALDGEL